MWESFSPTTRYMAAFLLFSVTLIATLLIVGSAHGRVLIAIRDAESRARFLGPDGLDSTEFLSQGGSAAIGTHFTTVAGPVADYPDARAFLED